MTTHSRIKPQKTNEVPLLPGCTQCTRCGEDEVSTRFYARRDDQEVMVEVLHIGGAADAVRERLRRNVGHIQSLDELHILPCIDVDVAGGRTYLVYPWPGVETLAKTLSPGEPLEPQKAIELVTEVVRGLEAMHRVGLVHGGLAPEKIFTGGDGIRIGGLGLALMQTPTHVKASDACLAPELVLGTALDQRADVHAAGVLLWRLSLGTWPWRIASSADLDVWARGDRPVVPDGLPQHLDSIIRRSMARSRDDRYALAQEMREDLERIAHGFAPLHARPATNRIRHAGAVTVHRLRVPSPPPYVPAPPSVPTVARSRRSFTIAIAGILVISVGIIGWMMMDSPPQPTVPTPAVSAVAVPAVTSPVMPSWARTFGRDAAGIWAEAGVGEVAFRLRLIPGGTALLGSPSTESGRRDDERAWNMTLSRSFWIAETEMTQALYQAATGTNPSRRLGQDLPVDNLTWDEAQTVCSRLAVLIPSFQARLPSEAEWEYACRAGTTGAFSLPAGDGSRLWDSSSSNSQSQVVGRLAANAWGLFDVHGNVLEWTADAYGPYPIASVIDYHLREGVQRAARGGSWAMDTHEARSAARFHFMPRAHLAWLGVRVAADGQLNDHVK